MEKKLQEAVERSKRRIAESKDLIKRCRAIIRGERNPRKAEKKAGKT
jgi:hypothetical protein